MWFAITSQFMSEALGPNLSLKVPAELERAQGNISWFRFQNPHIGGHSILRTRDNVDNLQKLFLKLPQA